VTILLISAAASDNAVARETVTAHARSDRDTETDQTPAFADVFVSLVAPRHQSSATPLDRNAGVRSNDDIAHNHKTRLIAATAKTKQDHHVTDRNHTTQTTRDATTPAPLSALTATEQRHGGDADANVTLPNRFSQIIAALPRTLNDAGNKDVNRDLPAERMRIASPDITIDKYTPDHINVHPTRPNTWQLQSRVTSPGTAPGETGNTAPGTRGKTAQSLSDNAQATAVVIKGADRAAIPSVEAVAFGKFLSHDMAPDHHNLPADQTITTASETLNNPGLTPMVTSRSLSNTVHGANVLFNTANIDRPLHGAQWGPEFSRQFVSLIRPGENGSHFAELRLDPPELGPLRVTININDSVVQAIFISSHSAVRNAVEQALPQLQQQLEQEGLSLGQTSVDQDDGASHSDVDDAARNARTRVRPEANRSDETNIVSMRPRAPDGLIDTFV